MRGGFVLGQTAKGRHITEPETIPPECGVMLREGERLTLARPAPRRPLEKMPFHVWMSLAKAAPMARLDESEQGLL